MNIEKKSVVKNTGLVFWGLAFFYFVFAVISAFLLGSVLIPFMFFLIVLGGTWFYRRRQEADSFEKASVFLQQVMDNDPKCIWIVNTRDQKILTTNKKCRDFFQLGETEANGATSLQLGLWRDPDDFRVYRNKLINDGFCENLVARGRKKNGENVYLNLSAYFVFFQGARYVWVTCYDITQQYLDENVPNASKALYEDLLLADENAIVVTQLSDGKVVNMNPRFCEVYGQDFYDLLGTYSESFFWKKPEDRKKFVAHLKAHGRCEKYQSVLSFSGIENIPVHIDGFLLEIDGAECIYAKVTSVLDVPSISNANALAKDQYDLLFEKSLDPISITRLSDGVYLDVNPAFLRISGCAREDIIGVSVRDIESWLYPEERESIRKELEEFGRSDEARVHLKTKYGTTLFCSISSWLVEIDGASCVYAVIRDISESVRDKEALLASQDLYRLTFNANDSGACVTRLSDWTVMECNDAFVVLCEYSREELIGNAIPQLGLWYDDADYQYFKEKLEKEGKCYAEEFLFTTKSGKKRWGSITAIQVMVEGEPSLYSIIKDVTDTRQALDDLKKSEAQYRLIFEGTSDAITLARMFTSEIVDVNQQFTKATGYTREEAVGQTTLSLGVWESEKDRLDILDELKEKGEVKGKDVVFRDKYGNKIWSSFSGRIMQVGDEWFVLTAVRDTTDSYKAKEKIHQLAYFDPLTNLPNRGFLNEQLGVLKPTHEICALISIDIDEFKVLNDMRGHDVGDAVLKSVANRLNDYAIGDVTIARLGGDEFAILMRNQGNVFAEVKNQINVYIEAMRGYLSRAYFVNGAAHRITVSTGVCMFSAGESSAETVLSRADMAMYKAKEMGRNNVLFFEKSMENSIRLRADLEEDLLHAIANEAINVAYQAQISHDDGLIGAEVLARWSHPEKGEILPGEFIALAEEVNAISDLGKSVLKKACGQLAKWAKYEKTAHLTLSVNVSAIEFAQAEYVDNVIAMLDMTGANPDRLILELTETVFLSDLEDAIKKMKCLQSLGVHFALDDFGTGYSSLSYLKDLPINRLKIDRTFVSGVIENESSASISKAVLSLAKNMNMDVVVEGIEVEAQHQFFLNEGCKTYQGYLFARPLFIEQFEKDFNLN